jgi:hypothetical protein
LCLFLLKSKFNHVELGIIKNGNSNSSKKKASEKTIKIYKFFKSLTSGKFDRKDKELIFPLFIAKYRREKILEAMMSDKDKPDAPK